MIYGVSKCECRKNAKKRCKKKAEMLKYLHFIHCVPLVFVVVVVVGAQPIVIFTCECHLQLCESRDITTHAFSSRGKECSKMPIE
jgi:hypothetical protein